MGWRPTAAAPRKKALLTAVGPLAPARAPKPPFSQALSRLPAPCQQVNISPEPHILWPKNGRTTRAQTSDTKLLTGPENPCLPTLAPLQ